MGAKSVWAVGLCLVLAGTAGEALRSGAAPVVQINIPSINPGLERRFEQLRQKEAQERRHKDNSADAQKVVALAAELKLYADGSESAGIPVDAVRKANELEKLARRIHGRLNDSAVRSRLH